VPLTEQRIVVVGAGSAGCGIASLLLREMIEAGLAERQARERFFDRDGLLVQGMAGILDFQQPFAQDATAVSTWSREQPNRVGLLDVVRNAKPTVLIGVSAQGGMFNEMVIRTMAAGTKRPIIFPLSNPTSCAEATPQDVMAWTDDRALIGTGSPFPPVTRDGMSFTVDQTNNAYVFPGVGLGVLAVKARRVTDGMFGAAAKVLADMSPAARDPPREPAASGRQATLRRQGGGTRGRAAGPPRRAMRAVRRCQTR
jgi:malate dehydrogenase (oxaloacetate-decarboxylating)